MIAEIFRFEVRYHLRQFLFYIVFVIFFLLAFGAVTSDSVTIGGSIGNVNRNAPFVIMQLLLVMSLFSVFTTTAFVSNAALRDFDLGTDSLFFSSPIRKRDYLIGRFAGSIFVSFLVYLGVVGGIMLGSFMPWLEKERIGPFTLAPYLHSLFVLILPTVLLVGAIFFCVAILSRSTMATYAGAAALFVGYFVANVVSSNSLESERKAALFDPFSVTSFDIATRYWTVAERNSKVLPLEGIFLANRLLWIGIALLIFAVTMRYFRFETGSRKARKRAAEGSPSPGPSLRRGAAATSVLLPSARGEGGAKRRMRGSPWLTQCLSTLTLELAGVVKSVPFVILAVVAVVNVGIGASFAGSIYDTRVYPVTAAMIEAIQSGYLLFALIIVTFYAGEIVFRERQRKLDEVTDSMPVASSAVWGGKLLALHAVVVLLFIVAMLTTVTVQTLKGYHDYDFALYARGLFGVVLLRTLLMATLAFVLQILTNNKYVGFLLMLLYLVSLQVLPAMHLEHNLYRYALAPQAPYSDMNGYGHFVRPIVWFNIYWWLFAGLLVLIGHLLWVRGTESAFGKRLHIARGRFGGTAKAALAVLLLAFLATGSYIYYNTNVLNHYRTTEDTEKRQANYEKQYKKYQRVPLPKITDAQADVDIYPAERRLSIRGQYWMANRTGAPIAELHVSTNPDTQSTITILGSSVRMADKDNGYTIYRLDPPLAPGASLPMRYTVEVAHRGFVNGQPQTDVVANGTFINNFAYFPHLGYLTGGELEDRNKRKKYGLPPIQRYPKIDDPWAHNVNQLTAESDWLNLDTTVSTSPDQIALAPGYLQKEWTAHGRRYFHYKTTSPILGFWSYLSAHYTVKRDHWHDVPIEIYYDAKHPYNVGDMIKSVKRSLDYYTANFSPYQHRQVRILEFPRYQRFAQSFPNTIPFSEAIGFIADVRDPDAIDYPFYVTAHEVGHQWWAHQVIGAQVQGTTFVTETLAQYSALMVMEKEFGRDKMHRFLEHELNAYLRGRGGELVAEMPLMLVENQPYIHYRKGALIMYALRDAIGEDAVNAALRKIIVRWAFQGPPYVRTLEFMDAFRSVTPPDKQSMLHDFFDVITLYDNKATSAKATKQPDGRYRVTFTVSCQKLVAEGMGKEKQVPVDEWIDIGVLSGKKDEKVLALEKRHITTPTATFDLTVSEKPTKAGIDPLNKLIDRNPDDNVKTVE